MYLIDKNELKNISGGVNFTSGVNKSTSEFLSWAVFTGNVPDGTEYYCKASNLVKIDTLKQGSISQYENEHATCDTINLNRIYYMYNFSTPPVTDANIPMTTANGQAVCKASFEYDLAGSPVFTDAQKASLLADCISRQ